MRGCGYSPLLVEVETYCRNGDLLTLSPPEEIRAFWIWFLLEFVRQADGDAPQSWLGMFATRLLSSVARAPARIAVAR